MLCILHGGIKKLPTRAAAQMDLLETCHTTVAVRWLISRIQAAWTDPLSAPYWSYYKQRETIFQWKSKRSNLWQLSLSLSLGFNFLQSCLKAITVASCQNRHGTRCVHVLFSSRCPHHSIWNGAHLSPSLASPHHFIPHLALWGRLQALVEVCVAATHLWEDPPQDEDRLRWQVWICPRCSSCINICPQLGRIQKGSFSFSWGELLVLCFVFLCMVRNGCTRAWRRWCTAAWKEFAPAVTSWYENTCDSWLFCTRFGWTTVTLKIHIGLILYILSFPPASSFQ